MQVLPSIAVDFDHSIASKLNSLGIHLEELDATVLNGGNNQGSIEIIIVLFARRFCNQQTAVTCRSVKESTLMQIIWLVLRADGIV